MSATIFAIITTGFLRRFAEPAHKKEAAQDASIFFMDSANAQALEGCIDFAEQPRLADCAEHLAAAEIYSSRRAFRRRQARFEVDLRSRIHDTRHAARHTL